MLATLYNNVCYLLLLYLFIKPTLERDCSARIRPERYSYGHPLAPEEVIAVLTQAHNTAISPDMNMAVPLRNAAFDGPSSVELWRHSTILRS